MVNEQIFSTHIGPQFANQKGFCLGGMLESTCFHCSKYMSLTLQLCKRVQNDTPRFCLHFLVYREVNIEYVLLDRNVTFK